jgi:hypothetical protein
VLLDPGVLLVPGVVVVPEVLTGLTSVLPRWEGSNTI